MVRPEDIALADALRQRLSEQLHSIDRLRSVSERQRKSLRSKDFVKLAEHERERQQIFEQIRKGDRELDRLKEAWKEKRDRMPSSEKQAIEGLMERLRDSLRNILAIEGDNINMVRELRDEVDRELRKLMGGRKATGYGSTRLAEGRFLDTRG